MTFDMSRMCPHRSSVTFYNTSYEKKRFSLKFFSSKSKLKCNFKARLYVHLPVIVSLYIIIIFENFFAVDHYEIKGFVTL